LRERAVKLRVGRTPEESKAGPGGELWGVIIGVSRYKYGDRDIGGNQIPNLKNAADDAQAVYDFLRSAEGGGFVPESEGGHMILLKDEQANKAEVERALAKLRESRPEDYYVVYLAAHGTVVPQRDPVSGRSELVPYFAVYDTDLEDMPSTAVRMVAFQEAVKLIPARRGIVLSDTCHSAGVQLAGRGVPATDTKLANDSLIKAMDGIEGVAFISAAEQTELSYESDDLNQGFFTYCLLDGLGGNADSDRDGTVTFLELKEYLREEVPRLTQGKQHPFFNTTSLEANRIALSIVRYPEGEWAGASAESFGLLIVRAPELDRVTVAVDDQVIATLTAGAQRWFRLPAGTRNLSFTKWDIKHSTQAVIQQGKPTVVEVNLAFSKDEDDLAGPNEQQLDVYLSEDKEPSDEARALFHKGVDSFNKQRFEAAADLLLRAVQADGQTYPDALVYLGRAQQSLGRDGAARASFQTALAQRPSDFEARTLLAEAKFNAGDNVEEVIKELREVIARHPNYDFARVVYADVLLTRRDFGGAERQARRAITIRRRSPPARMALAEALTYQNSKLKQKEAVDEAETAVRLLAELAEKQVSVRRGLKWLSISHVMFGGGRYLNTAAMAEAHYLAAKAINNLVNREDAPADADALLDRARLHIQESHKLAQAAGNKRRLMLAFDTSAKTHFLKGSDAAAIKDAQQALKIIESTPRLKHYAEPHYILCVAYENQQNYAKAYQHLQKYIEVSRPAMSSADVMEKEDHLDRLRRLKEANRQD
jgi:tetratricopeptide (TPR) repeat protein